MYRKCPKELYRATSLEKYLKAYIKEQGTSWEGGIRDVLTDVLHICRQKGIVYNIVIDGARDVAFEELEDRIHAIDPQLIPTLLPLDDLDPDEIEVLEAELKRRKGY